MALQFPPANLEPSEVPWQREVERRLRADQADIDQLTQSVNIQQNTVQAQARGIATQTSATAAIMTRTSDVNFSRNYSNTIPPSGFGQTVVSSNPINLDRDKYRSIGLTYTCSIWLAANAGFEPTGVVPFANLNYINTTTGAATFFKGFTSIGTTPEPVEWETDKINTGKSYWYMNGIVQQRILMDDLNPAYQQLRLDLVFGLEQTSPYVLTSFIAFVSGSAICYYRDDYWKNNANLS